MRNEPGEREEIPLEIKPVLEALPPADSIDPVIEAYKKDIDRTLIRENLKLSYLGRLKKLERAAAAMARWRGVAQRPSNRPRQEGE